MLEYWRLPEATARKVREGWMWTGDEVVKAVVVPAPGIAATPALEAELRDHARAALAAYRAPRRFEFVAELPLTTTGKVNRAELRRRETEQPQD